MDQKEMMERLKRDPAALQAVMGSRDCLLYTSPSPRD